jgi:DNA topoisomerase-1
MKLLIVESPGKIATLKKYLGPDWEVAASYGHIRDLPVKDIGVTPPTFKPTYEFNERGKSTVAKLKALASRASEVYLASDPDREGEAISWHLAQTLGLKSPKRITFNAITSDQVRAAVAAPRAIDANLVQAQEARRVLDRLVGYLVSGPLSNACDQRGLSAGRVQSVAVKLVVLRERAIRQFKPVEHYGARLHFEGGWSAEWVPGKLIPKGQDHWLDKPFAEAASKVSDLQVVEFQEPEVLREPPAPFTTSTLQQAASASLGMDPEDAMKLAQGLYEAGAITYMRTDSPNLSDEGYALLCAYARSAGLALAPRRSWVSKAGAQEAHEAIRPTHFEVETAGSSEGEKKLYALIRNRALASQMEAAKYKARVAKLRSRAPVGGSLLDFEARGSTLVSPGWMVMTGKDATVEEEDASTRNPIPALTEGQALKANRGELLIKVTKPPLRYTQAALVKELEAKGVGRPSTYASTLAAIITKRAYVRQDKKKLYATPVAESIVDKLEGVFSFMQVSFTKAMEEELDHIAEGKARYLDVVSKAYAELTAELATFGHVRPAAAPRPAPVLSAYKCPACKKPLVHRQKAGEYDFWGCSGFPTCRKTYKDNKGKPVL